jgi:folate-dependent phosphoribosylglycinamide formyltransferase PurN
MGVSLHEVTAELDGGPIVRQLRFYHQGQWKKHQPSLAESQINLSFTEQRLVRETAKVWK